MNKPEHYEIYDRLVSVLPCDQGMAHRLSHLTFGAITRLACKISESFCQSQPQTEAMVQGVLMGLEMGHDYALCFGRLLDEVGDEDPLDPGDPGETGGLND